MLNFIRQNLSKCTKDVKFTAYLSLVRPILEYSSPVWDRYLLADIQSIEKVRVGSWRWVIPFIRRQAAVLWLISLRIDIGTALLANFIASYLQLASYMY